MAAARYIDFYPAGGEQVTAILASELRCMSLAHNRTRLVLVFEYQHEGERQGDPVIVRLTGRNLGAVKTAIKAGDWGSSHSPRIFSQIRG